MKRILLTLILVLALPFAAGAQAAAPATEELTRLLKYFLDGASRNDVKVHERFWADDLIYTRSAGVRMGKAEILENARSGPTATAEDPTTYTGEDIRIQQYGDTAVVAFRLVGTTGSGDKAIVTQYLNTGTFVKRNGEWRAAAWQATRVPARRAEEGSGGQPDAGRRRHGPACTRKSSRPTPRSSRRSSTPAMSRPCAATSPTTSRCSTTRAAASARRARRS